MKTPLVVVILVVCFQELMMPISAQYRDEIKSVMDEWHRIRDGDHVNFLPRMHTLTLNVKHLVDDEFINPESQTEEYKWKYGFFLMNYWLPENRLVASSKISLPSINQWQKSQSYLNNMELSETDKKSVDFIKRFHDRLREENEKTKLDHQVDNIKTPLQKPYTEPSANSFKPGITESEKIVKLESILPSATGKTGQTYLDSNIDIDFKPDSYSGSEKTTNSNSKTNPNTFSDVVVDPVPTSPHNVPSRHQTSDINPGYPHSSASYSPLSFQSPDTRSDLKSSSAVYRPLADQITDLINGPSPSSHSHEQAQHKSDIALGPPPNHASGISLAHQPSDMNHGPLPSLISFKTQSHQSFGIAQDPLRSSDSEIPLAKENSQLIHGPLTKANNFHVLGDHSSGSAPGSPSMIVPYKPLANEKTELISGSSSSSPSFKVAKDQFYDTASNLPPTTDSVKSSAIKGSEMTTLPASSSTSLRPVKHETPNKVLKIYSQYRNEIESVTDEWDRIRDGDQVNFRPRMHTLTLNVKHLVDDGLIKPESRVEYKWKYGFSLMNYCLPENQLVASTKISLPSINQWQESQSYLNNMESSETDKKSVDFIKRFHDRLREDNGENKLDRQVNNVKNPLQKPYIEPSANSFKPVITESEEIVKLESISNFATGNIYLDSKIDTDFKSNSYSGPEFSEEPTSSKSKIIPNTFSDIVVEPLPSSPQNISPGHQKSDMTSRYPENSASYTPLSIQSPDPQSDLKSSSPLYRPLVHQITDLINSPSLSSPSLELDQHKSDIPLGPPPNPISGISSAHQPSDITLSPSSSLISSTTQRHQSFGTAQDPPHSKDSDKPLAKESSEFINGPLMKTNNFNVLGGHSYGSAPESPPGTVPYKPLVHEKSELIYDSPPKSTSFDVAKDQHYVTTQKPPPTTDSVKSSAIKDSVMTTIPSSSLTSLRPLTHPTLNKVQDALIHVSSNNYPKTDRFESSSTNSRLLRTSDQKISNPGAVKVSFSSDRDSNSDASLFFYKPRSLQTQHRAYTTACAGCRSRRGRGRGPWQ